MLHTRQLWGAYNTAVAMFNLGSPCCQSQHTCHLQTYVALMSMVTVAGLHAYSHLQWPPGFAAGCTWHHGDIAQQRQLVWHWRLIDKKHAGERVCLPLGVSGTFCDTCRKFNMLDGCNRFHIAARNSMAIRSHQVLYSLYSPLMPTPHWECLLSAACSAHDDQVCKDRPI